MRFSRPAPPGASAGRSEAIVLTIALAPIIADGELMGSDAPGAMPPLVFRHEPSTTVLGSRAYAVYPQHIN
jgi:hypothetical protein